jgi:hypothetical protein
LLSTLCASIGVSDDSQRKRQLRRDNHGQIKVLSSAAHFRRNDERMFREENQTNVQKSKSKKSADAIRQNHIAALMQTVIAGHDKRLARK